MTTTTPPKQSGRAKTKSGAGKFVIMVIGFSLATGYFVYEAIDADPLIGVDLPMAFAFAFFSLAVTMGVQAWNQHQSHKSQQAILDEIRSLIASH